MILKGRRKYYIHLYILCYIIYNSILIWKVITDEAKRLHEIVFLESIYIFLIHFMVGAYEYLYYFIQYISDLIEREMLYFPTAL